MIKMANNMNLPNVNNSQAAKQSRPLPAAKSEEPKSVMEGYASRRVDCKLTTKQAIKFRDIQRRLQDSGETLADGSYVTNRARAIQWLIENH